ncbi:hypothetical protein ABT297_18345 [Dactylosporangium sp. NPDC000555]|uniref:hypothetical protein n=1 Tax=Dactylosporangium sp. NPDC000555 TaxID=3154260 RepID=UPI003333EA3D
MVSVGFGPKMAWLAVRAEPDPVMEALGLRDLGDVEPRTGLDLAHFTDDRVVVATVDKWTLVAGKWLFRWNGIAALSMRTGAEAQYFATDRSLVMHRWARARGADVFVSDEEALVDENDVFRTAAEWSVDPRVLPVMSLRIAAVPVHE